MPGAGAAADGALAEADAAAGAVAGPTGAALARPGTPREMRMAATAVNARVPALADIKVLRTRIKMAHNADKLIICGSPDDAPEFTEAS
jgi:hypothetical protein